MHAKPKQQSGKFPSEAVAFVRKLIGAGVPRGFFSDYTHETPINELQFALALATLSRLNVDSSVPPVYIFTPIALGWHLEGEKAGHYSLCAQNQFSGVRNIPGDAIFTNQLQPELAPTAATVVEIKCAGCGVKLLQEICQFSFEDGNAVKYLLESRTGLGIAHAEKVADMFFIQPLNFVHAITPVVGPGSSGRSLFILLEYRAFAGRDDMTGVPTLGWLEIRVISAKAERRKNHGVLVSLHSDLSYPVPENSLMALANIKWFKEERPASE